MFNHLKQNNNRLTILISCMVIAGVVFAFWSSSRVLGQTADQLAQQKQQKQLELDALQKKISDYQSEIKQKQSQAKTLANQISILNLQIAQTTTQIDVANNKIEATNLEIADVTDKIVKTQANIGHQKQILRALVSDINDLDQRSPLEIALENDNFQQFIDQVQYTSSIQQQSQQALTKIKQLEADLVLRQADLKTEKSNLDDLLAELEMSKKSLAGQQSAKQTVLNQTKGQEKAYQALLADSREAQAQLNKEIQDLDAQISAKLGNRRLSPIHGLLAWPMKGTMTQGYGNTGFTSLGYNFHNGLDLAAPPGTPIYAAADGVVVATGTGNGAYGNWVAIKHGSGRFAAHPIVSLYGHMSSFRMRAGQAVSMGDLVGFEGNTGNTTALLYGPKRGYHLHFTVFDAEGFGVANGAYSKIYGPYTVPYGAPYNPLDFL